MPFYQGKKEFSDKFIGDPTTWTTQTTKVAARGDILMSVRAPVGPVNFARDECCIGRGLAAIRGQNGLNQDFLFYFFLWKQDEISGRAGAVFPSISKGEIEQIQIPYPSQEERLRIVAILDKVFAAIATAKANTERNLLNGRALFDSHLENIFAERGKNWNKETLQTLLDGGLIEGHLDGNHGSEYPRKEEFKKEGVPYISANCLDNDQVDLSRAKYLSPSRAAQIRKGIAKNGDVLFAHNATVGPVGILRTGEPKIILGTSLTYYRCNRSHLVPEYLAHYMRSSGFRSQYEAVMRQSTRNQVPITKQREFYHVIPPLPDQRAIVRELDQLLTGSQHLASGYQRRLSDMEELRKSLLDRAFAGAL